MLFTAHSFNIVRVLLDEVFHLIQTFQGGPPYLPFEFDLHYVDWDSGEVPTRSPGLEQFLSGNYAYEVSLEFPEKLWGSMELWRSHRGSVVVAMGRTGGDDGRGGKLPITSGRSEESQRANANRKEFLPSQFRDIIPESVTHSG